MRIHTRVQGMANVIGLDLWRHINTDTWARPFFCRKCGKEFSGKAVLSTHCRNKKHYRDNGLELQQVNQNEFLPIQNEWLSLLSLSKFQNLSLHCNQINQSQLFERVSRKDSVRTMICFLTTMLHWNPFANHKNFPTTFLHLQYICCNVDESSCNAEKNDQQYQEYLKQVSNKVYNKSKFVQ